MAFACTAGTFKTPRFQRGRICGLCVLACGVSVGDSVRSTCAAGSVASTSNDCNMFQNKSVPKTTPSMRSSDCQFKGNFNCIAGTSAMVQQGFAKHNFLRRRKRLQANHSRLPTERNFCLGIHANLLADKFFCMGKRVFHRLVISEQGILHRQERHFVFAWPWN